jgi:hypothetical protein
MPGTVGRSFVSCTLVTIPTWLGTPAALGQLWCNSRFCTGTALVAQLAGTVNDTLLVLTALPHLSGAQVPAWAWQGSRAQG